MKYLVLEILALHINISNPLVIAEQSILYLCIQGRSQKLISVRYFRLAWLVDYTAYSLINPNILEEEMLFSIFLLLSITGLQFKLGTSVLSVIFVSHAIQVLSVTSFGMVYFGIISEMCIALTGSTRSGFIYR